MKNFYIFKNLYIYILFYIGVACKIKLGGGPERVKLNRGAMTNESYIIVGFCQSILMNLSSFIKQLGRGQAPQLTRALRL